MRKELSSDQKSLYKYLVNAIKSYGHFPTANSISRDKSSYLNNIGKLVYDIKILEIYGYLLDTNLFEGPESKW